MEIGKQIRTLRMNANLSQDQLAEKIYVSRQTISNWENDKNYPDIKSLALLSNLFDVTLDALVKGDIEEMKEQIKKEDIQKFNQASVIFTVLLASTIILPVPLGKFLGNIGWAIWGVIAIISFCYAGKVEKLKKSFNVQTYKEILAFVEGKQLDTNERNQEQGKRPYQKLLLAMGAALATIIAAIIMTYLLK